MPPSSTDRAIKALADDEAIATKKTNDAVFGESDRFSGSAEFRITSTNPPVLNFDCRRVRSPSSSKSKIRKHT